MKNIQEILRGGAAPVECSRAPHTICLADFDTNYPNTNRIDRIASEIDEYLRHKQKYAKR